MKKAIIAISGGIDSTVAAGIAKKEGYELYFLTVDYGQKNIKKELENSKKLAKYFGAKEHKIIDMKWLGELGNSGITDLNIHFENVSDDFIYVPYRNTCIISACVAWAEVNHADVIYTGSEAGPWICPDNSPEYYKALNNLTAISTKLNKDIKIVAPLNDSDKVGNIKKGMELNIPFEYTWTCVARDDKACGICQPCRDRLQAFEKAGMKDPIKYVTEKDSKNYNSNIFLFITVLYVACILISNILASKIISVFGIAMTGGVLVFPITYIIGDVLTEIYGYKKTKKVILYGFLCNLLMVIIFFLAIKLPYPSYWHNQESFVAILENTPRILFASFVGYLIGGFSNSYIMDYIKNNSKIKFLWFRTILSTIVGETLDTGLFLMIGFFGTMGNNVLFTMIICQTIAKVLYEIAFTPITYFVVKKVRKLEEEN